MAFGNWGTLGANRRVIRHHEMVALRRLGSRKTAIRSALDNCGARTRLGRHTVNAHDMRKFGFLNLDVVTASLEIGRRLSALARQCRTGKQHADFVRYSAHLFVDEAVGRQNHRAAQRVRFAGKIRHAATRFLHQ